MLQKITITDLIGEQLDRVTSNSFMQAFIVLLTTFVLAKRKFKENLEPNN